MFQFHKIESIKALPNFQLSAVFVNGEIRQYDASKLFNKLNCFEKLKTEPGLFEKVYVDPHGYGIIWNENLDLSAEEIYQNGYIES